jgi:predicted transcriptional regulator
MNEIEKSSEVAALTVQLLSAYLANNTVPSEGLPDLIRSTKAALTEDIAADAPAAESETFTPAVSVRKSLASQDHIVSLIDGKPYKVLKRHLATHGLTPDAYRERYGLPASYPMVAPSFAAHRRAIAERIGLGNRNRPAAKAAEPASQTATTPAPEPTPAPKPAPAPAPVVAAPAADAPAPAPKRAAKPKPKSAPKAATKAEPKLAPKVAEATPASEPAPKKPRGKLGLFGKEEAPAQTAAVETAPAAEAKTEKAPARPKRMARAPKPASEEATPAAKKPRK